jgi:hypothetical protein
MHNGKGLNEETPLMAADHPQLENERRRNLWELSRWVWIYSRADHGRDFEPLYDQSQALSLPSSVHSETSATFRDTPSMRSLN